MARMDSTDVGSCVVCTGDTDTGLGVRGPAEAAIAVLEACGLPPDQARTRIERFAQDAFGCEPGRVRVGVQTWGLQLCERCAAPLAEHDMAVRPVTEGIPVYELGA